MPYTCDSLGDLESDLLTCIQMLESILTGTIETLDSACDKTPFPEYRKTTMADAKKTAHHQKIRLMAMYEFLERHNMDAGHE